MQIAELSRQTGASVRSIRYYETKGLLESTRLENGYRDFAPAAAERVKAIQLYLSVGLNIAEIAQMFDCTTWGENARPLCPQALELYKTRLDTVNKSIELLIRMRTQLQARIDSFEQPNPQGE